MDRLPVARNYLLTFDIIIGGPHRKGLNLVSFCLLGFGRTTWQSQGTLRD